MPRETPSEASPTGLAPVADPGSVAERELVAAILQKDRKATARFVAEYTDGVYAYVRHRLAPRAELVDDVVQDVFLAALGGLSTFRGTSPLRSWLLGIARHKVESFYRQQLREPEPLADGGDAFEPTAGGVLIDEQIDRERLEAKTQRVLKQLPESYGLALLWRYWENRSVRDMAEATGRTEKAIERLLARARARFRELWDQVER
jgi:RNA polymerase sigma-70 factor (ECF subfamily)